jgi:hypothetical protein
LPERLVTHCRHFGMSAADMSYGGSSQHNTTLTFPTKVNIGHCKRQLDAGQHASDW